MRVIGIEDVQLFVCDSSIRSRLRRSLCPSVSVYDFTCCCHWLRHRRHIGCFNI